MSVEIAWKQNILVTDFHLLKSLLVVFGFGSQAFVCGFSRQNINSVDTDIKVISYRISSKIIKQCMYYVPEQVTKLSKIGFEENKLGFIRTNGFY